MRRLVDVSHSGLAVRKGRECDTYLLVSTLDLVFAFILDIDSTIYVHYGAHEIKGKYGQMKQHSFDDVVADDSQTKLNQNCVVN